MVRRGSKGSRRIWHLRALYGSRADLDRVVWPRCRFACRDPSPGAARERRFHCRIIGASTPMIDRIRATMTAETIDESSVADTPAVCTSIGSDLDGCGHFLGHSVPRRVRAQPDAVLDRLRQGGIFSPIVGFGDSPCNHLHPANDAPSHFACLGGRGYAVSDAPLSPSGLCYLPASKLVWPLPAALPVWLQVLGSVDAAD